MDNKDFKKPILGDPNGIHVEIWFDEKEGDEGLYYGFRFLSGTNLLFNPDEMISDVIRTYEYKEDYFIPFLHNLIKTGKPNHWLPIEPDVTIYASVFENSLYEFNIVADGHFTKSVSSRNESYVGDGPSVNISVERNELIYFISDLEQDYNRFKNIYKEFFPKN